MAIESYKEAQRIGRSLRNLSSQKVALSGLGDCYHAVGEVELAIDAFDQRALLDSNWHNATHSDWNASQGTSQKFKLTE